MTWRLPAGGTSRGRRGALARGFTLIELMVTIAIIIVLITVGAVALGSMRAADADTTANVLAGAMRYVSTLAVQYNKTYRLVIDLDRRPCEGDPSQCIRWWAEAANTDDPCGRFVPDDADPPQEAAIADGGRAAAAAAVDGEDEALDGAVADTATFAREDAELLSGAFEPDTTVSAVLTEHHQEPQTQGKVAVYFYPNGYAERAFVWVAEEVEDDGVTTLRPEITLALEALGGVQRYGAVLDAAAFYREVRQ